MNETDNCLVCGDPRTIDSPYMQTCSEECEKKCDTVIVNHHRRGKEHE